MKGSIVDRALLISALTSACQAAPELAEMQQALVARLRNDTDWRARMPARIDETCPWACGLFEMMDPKSVEPAFSGLKNWLRPDGGPITGWDQQLEIQVGIGCVAVALAGDHLDRLSESFRSDLSRACFYLIVRHAGSRLARREQWGLWISTLCRVRAEAVEGLPFRVTGVASTDAGLPEVELQGVVGTNWYASAFRSSDVAVVLGQGLSAVGTRTGCHFYDGKGLVASVSGNGGGWAIEGVRSETSQAGFRLVNTHGSRLILTGKQGRFALVSECFRPVHSLRLFVQEDLMDDGPRQFRNERASLSLDRSAAWRFCDGAWVGEMREAVTPNRLRVNFVPSR